MLGAHHADDFVSQDLIIRNPGVSELSPFLQVAREHQIPIKMETALFTKYAHNKTIGITGTRGKSTTSHLVAHILKTAGRNVVLAGNLPGRAALPLLKSISKAQDVVLELSSWQLQGFRDEKISPHISVITSLYPDHLNRYASMKEYIRDKTYIFKFQTPLDYIILNKDNPQVVKLADQVTSQLIWFSHRDLPEDFVLKIPGIHNRENAAAAMAICKLMDVSDEQILRSLATFTGVPYRLETIANINGVEIINDTTSTTPVATVKALEAITKPITLIIGGESKNLPTDQLIEAVNARVKKVVLLSGSGTAEIKPALQKTLIITETKDLPTAVAAGLENTKSGGTLLFSPGFTSFGLFLNEFDRGKEFNKIVKQLSHDQTPA